MRFQLYDEIDNINRLQPSAEDQRFVVGKGRGVALVAQQLHEQSPNLASQIRHCRRYLHPGKRFARKRKWSRIGVVLAVESKTCSRQKNRSEEHTSELQSHS